MLRVSDLKTKQFNHSWKIEKKQKTVIAILLNMY